MTVTIPACTQHEGMYSITIEIPDTCPTCGGPRANTTFKQLSYDGSLRLLVDSWHNPCGHVDKYEAVRIEYVRLQGQQALLPTE